MTFSASPNYLPVFMALDILLEKFLDLKNVLMVITQGEGYIITWQFSEFMEESLKYEVIENRSD